jgi:RNA ligase (TIGR02306 family)
MSEWNPQVVKIEKAEKHSDADTLSVYTVLGDYPVIDKLDKYRVGDLVGYLPIDTIVPDTIDYYFLCPQAYEKQENKADKPKAIGPKYPLGMVPERYRTIKAKKLRGVYSMGMLVKAPAELKEGDSIVEPLGLKKVEEEAEENIPAFKRMRGSNAESPPKGWTIPYYDIEGVRKYLSCFQDSEEVVLMEKVHGSNASFCHDGEKLWCKSRLWFKKQDPTDPWWDIAIRYDLENKLAKFPHMAFFGELYGLVKHFPYDAEIVEGKRHSKLRFFDIYDTKAMRWIDYDDCVRMVKEAGLEMMPELYRGLWKGKEEMYPYAEGLTTMGGRHVREGFVVKSVRNRYEPKLNSRLILKLHGEGFNLAK